MKCRVLYLGNMEPILSERRLSGIWSTGAYGKGGAENIVTHKVGGSVGACVCSGSAAEAQALKGVYNVFLCEVLALKWQGDCFACRFGTLP